MATDARRSLVHIPKEIPQHLFVKVSSTEYCRQVRLRRLELRRRKYGEAAIGSEEEFTSLSSPEKAPESKANYDFPKAKKSSNLFSSTMTQAASLVALFVIGFACYSSYFAS